MALGAASDVHEYQARLGLRKAARALREVKKSARGRSFEEAMRLALPDPGSHVEVFVTCAKDGGAARLPHTYEKGILVRSFRRKGK